MNETGQITMYCCLYYYFSFRISDSIMYKIGIWLLDPHSVIPELIKTGFGVYSNLGSWETVRFSI